MAKEDTVQSEAIAADAEEVVIMAQAIHVELTWHCPAIIVSLDSTFAIGSAVEAHLQEVELGENSEPEEYLPEEQEALAVGGEYARTLTQCSGATVQPSSLSQAEITRQRESKAQSCLLRCIFGNPFRPVTVSPSWQTATVTSLAQAIYDERAFDRMPILADALEDAGCDNAEFLNHCRQPGEHVRGCWVLDLLLDKK